jgi:hypothetical protein
MGVGDAQASCILPIARSTGDVEDYLYPETWLARIELPSKANRLFIHSA